MFISLPVRITSFFPMSRCMVHFAKCSGVKVEGKMFVHDTAHNKVFNNQLMISRKKNYVFE